MKTLHTMRWIGSNRYFVGLAAALVVAVGVLAGGRAFASSPPFTLSVSPASETIAAGSSARYLVTVTSQHGFTGTVNIGVAGASPSKNNGPAFHLTRYDIYVSRTSPTGTATLTVLTTASTPATTYTVTFKGKDITSGKDYGFTETTTFTLTVTP